MYGAASSYQRTANDEILIIPMIETHEAIDNIDEILDVPGISGIYVGPPISACRSAGRRSWITRIRETLAIYDRIIEQTNRREIFPAIHERASRACVPHAPARAPARDRVERYRADGLGSNGSRAGDAQGRWPVAR